MSSCGHLNEHALRKYRFGKGSCSAPPRLHAKGVMQQNDAVPGSYTFEIDAEPESNHAEMQTQAR